MSESQGFDKQGYDPRVVTNQSPPVYVVHTGGVTVPMSSTEMVTDGPTTAEIKGRLIERIKDAKITGISKEVSYLFTEEGIWDFDKLLDMNETQLTTICTIAENREEVERLYPTLV